MPIIKKREFNGKPINNTRRVERALLLIRYLNDYRSIKEISRELDVHEKSVHRYLNLLVQLGFEVEVMRKKIYHFRVKNTKEFFGVT